MQRNPFKGPTNNASQHILPIRQETGPKFKKHRKDVLSKKEKEWGKVKFSPIVAQPATPWAKFKTEIMQKQEESGSNMQSEEANQFLKTREKNYRRMLIAETQKGPTKWEDFSEEADETRAGSGNVEIRKLSKKKGKCGVGRQGPISEVTTNNNKLINKELLSNFDSKKLTFDQKNILRKTITKTTHLARGATLKSVVEDMKKRGLKRKSMNTDYN